MSEILAWDRNSYLTHAIKQAVTFELYIILDVLVVMCAIMVIK